MSQELTIDQLLRRHAAQTPNAIAVASPERKPLTYRGLIDQVDYVAHFLAISGLTRKDCVAIVLPNGAEMAVAFLGVSSGAISAPLNPGYREAEFDSYLSELNARALIVQSGSDSPAIAIAQKRNIPVIDLSPGVDGIAGLFHLRAEQINGNSVGRRSEPTDVALILHTSGTTSRAKMVPLTHANLLASARNIVTSLSLTSDDRCLNVMPLFHIHGLVGALLSSLMAGSSVLCAPGFDSDNFFSWLETFHPSWYTAVPTIHQAVLSAADAKVNVFSHCSLRFIRSSSSALPPQVMRGLENVFHVPVIEAYGMTEAAHQICSNLLPPGERKAGSVGLAAGPQVSIIDGDGRLVPAGNVGEVVIHGANVMGGYANDSADSFTNGWFRTGDQGYLNDDGYLFITGRLKEIINRGGEKISPREIDDVLLEHPSIMEAVTFGISHATLGEDVATAVVLRKQVGTTELELQQFVASRLADFKVPRQIIIVDAIPKAATGKIQRIGLADKLGLIDTHEELDTRRTVFATPRTQTDQTLTGIWSAVLGLDVGLEDNFFHLGGNSIHTAQIISRVRESLGVELSFPTFFEAPSVAAMARVIATASQKLRSIKALPFPEDSVGPLSFTQEALWFLDQLDPGNPAYNRPVFARLQGNLETSILEKCLSEILRRHSSLRSRFPAEDGEPVQHIYVVEDFSLLVTDISSLPVREREAQLRKLAAEEARKPFDLARGPTFRMTLIRVEQRLHVLLATAHHIVIDGWSAEIFLRELQTLYDAFASGRVSPLADLPIQYLAFARWQRDSANNELVKEYVDFWKRKLAAGIPPLDLISERPRPLIQTFNGAKRVFTLSKNLLEGLKAISRQQEVTLFMTLLAAFKILLHHYSSQQDIIVGTPFAGRNQIHTESMIGNFTTTLPLHTNLSGNPSFRELLARVRKTVQEAHAHQDVPFETIAPQLRMKRDSSRPSVYQVLFQLRNYPRDFKQSGELRIEKYERESESSAVDMSLSISEDRNGLAYDIVYNTDLFDDATIGRMAAQFDNLVKNIVANPDQKLSDFPWLTESKQRASELSELTDAEANPLLTEGNNIEDDHATESCRQELCKVQIEKSSADTFPRVVPNLSLKQESIRGKCFHPTCAFVGFSKEEVEQSIPERFEKIVRMYPDRVAVKSKNQTVTYEALNRQANRISEALHSEHEEIPGTVALLLGHCTGAIAGILGVLKAAKIYVPLDPSYPRARLSSILENSEATVILTDSHNLPLAKEFSQGRLRLLNVEDLDGGQSTRTLDVVTSPDATASIFYTSGSTGMPKGVIQTHRTVLHRVMTDVNNFHICPDDRLSLVSSPTYSVSLRNLFGALLNGAAVYPFDVETEGFPRLSAWLQQEQITIYFSVPTVFRKLTDCCGDGQSFNALRLIYLAGEAVTRRDVDLYRKHFPNTILVNSLASNEAGIIRQLFVDIDTDVSGDKVPAGYAVDGKEILILDDDGKEMNDERVGEIAVKSRYLSPGYWSNPEMTAALFRPDPNGGEDRIYRTGDLGYLLPDGCLMHLGRKGSRVKIRGSRVELDEVQVNLRVHPAVRETVVDVRKDRSGEEYLIAYIVPVNAQAPTSDELSNHLRSRLPNYMIPSRFVFLDTLPLTPNGKLDRRALPDPGTSRPDLGTTFVAPKTSVEQKLAQIWAEVLSLDQVGIDDNFFDLGGHSLAATRVVSQVIKIFQLEVPLQSLFQAPTVAKMAAVITDYQAQRSVVPAQTIVSRKQDSQTAVLSFAQKRLWFLSKLDLKSPAYNQPNAIRLLGILDMEILKRSLEAVIARHEVLRTTYSAIDGQPSPVVSHDVSIELPIIDLSGYAETEREIKLQSRIAEIIEQPFDLSRDLTLRAALLKLGPAEFVLLLVTHHIASDGWSSEILQHEITTLYEAFITGDPNPLPALPIQYTDYAVWQREWISGKVLEKQLYYWKTQLSNIPTLELPTDRARPAVQTYRGARQSAVFSEALSKQLNSLSRSEGVTLFMTLLAAVQTLLYRYTGQEDVAVGSPIAGRTRFEFEKLIGVFINTLVLRTDLSGNPTFRALLARVRTVALEAYQHQDVPFEKVVEEINPERHLGHTPLFRVNFAFQNVPRQTLDLAGLRISPIEIEKEPAKFDLTLYAWEEAHGLKFSVVYNTDLFDASTITRMLEHIETLLKSVVSDPNQRISDLPILTEKETHELLVEWNDPQRDYPNACIQDLFERQVAKTPDAVAIIFEDQQLTYRQLNSRANQLAHCLRRRGAGPETLIAICAERSLELVIGLVGILKAGAAYLPLDPSYPAERIAFMLEDADVRVLLTQEFIRTGSLSFVINGSSTRETVCLDSDWKTIAQESTENPTRNAAPENLAYVIYTSGSTGKPKGVMVTHANVVRLFSVTEPWFAFNDRDVWTLFHSYAFDFSVWEMWGALLSGGRLVVVPYWVSRSPEAFWELSKKENVTVLNQTPSAFRQLMPFAIGNGRAEPLSLRWIIFGGEALDLQSLRPWMDCYGDHNPQLVNMYGITETTVHVTYRPFTLADTYSNSRSLIGRPLPDLQIYLLDENRHLVPIGVPGEAYIAGAGVARGYLNRLELTDERFILHSFDGEQQPLRLYRSGDRARRLSNGDFEYLGRIDNQVKIRGFRIELGEIEAVLNQHPAVREVAVIARENGPDDQQLVGYVVVRHSGTPSINELRGFIKVKLPDYMIPAAFVFLDTLPLTPNGKVDRRALPAPGPRRPELEQAFVAPQNDFENSIAAIWRDALHLEKVGIHDNFFDLGGHSLLLVQVHSRLQRIVDRELALIEMFEYPTVHFMATHLGQETRHSLQQNQDHIQNRSDSKNRITRQRLQRQRLSQGE